MQMFQKNYPLYCLTFDWEFQWFGASRDQFTRCHQHSRHLRRHHIVTCPSQNLSHFTVADPGFWSGGPSRVLTPEGPEPKICLKTAWFWKTNLGDKGGPGPPGPPGYASVSFCSTWWNPRTQPRKWHQKSCRTTNVPGNVLAIRRNKNLSVSQKIFLLSIFYVFLDILCHLECLKKFSPKIFWVKQGATQCYQAFLVSTPV